MSTSGTIRLLQASTGLPREAPILSTPKQTQSVFRNEPAAPPDLPHWVRQNLYRDENAITIIKMDIFSHRSLPDSKPVPSCVGDAGAPLMIIIIFWVQHRSGVPSNKLWRRGVWKQVRTHRSRGNRASCTWCDAGLGSR